MIKVGKSDVRSLAKEMTLKEWEVVREMTKRVSDKGDEFGAIDAWFQIFEMLGASESDTDRLKGSELLDLIVEFNKDEVERVFARTVVLNGKVYEAYAEGEEFVMTGKTMAVIERIAKVDGEVTFAQILAAIFKDTEMTRAEHYDVAHVKHKAQFFGEMQADIALPYLADFGIEIAEILKVKEANGLTEVVE